MNINVFGEHSQLKQDTAIKLKSAHHNLRVFGGTPEEIQIIQETATNGRKNMYFQVPGDIYEQHGAPLMTLQNATAEGLIITPSKNLDKTLKATALAIEALMKTAKKEQVLGIITPTIEEIAEYGNQEQSIKELVNTFIDQLHKSGIGAFVLTEGKDKASSFSQLTNNINEWEHHEAQAA